MTTVIRKRIDSDTFSMHQQAYVYKADGQIRSDVNLGETFWGELDQGGLSQH